MRTILLLLITASVANAANVKVTATAYIQDMRNSDRDEGSIGSNPPDLHYRASFGLPGHHPANVGHAQVKRSRGNPFGIVRIDGIKDVDNSYQAGVSFRIESDTTMYWHWNLWDWGPSADDYYNETMFAAFSYKNGEATEQNLEEKEASLLPTRPDPTFSRHGLLLVDGSDDYTEINLEIDALTGDAPLKSKSFLLKGYVAGDANFDDKVDFLDFLQIANSITYNLEIDDQRHNGWDFGDFDGSGTVDFRDFVMLAENYGFEKPESFVVPVEGEPSKHMPVPAPGPVPERPDTVDAIANIPEPSGLFLASISLFVLVRISKNRVRPS